MTLLIATQDINAPAETYVRQHMRCLAPGATVGVGLQGGGRPPTYPCPSIWSEAGPRTAGPACSANLPQRAR